MHILTASVMATSTLRYNAKVTIVTGGSKGIGEGVVREFGKYCYLMSFSKIIFPCKVDCVWKYQRRKAIKGC